MHDVFWLHDFFMCLEPIRAGLDLSFMCIALSCRAKLLVVGLFPHHAPLRLDNVRACSSEPWWQLKHMMVSGRGTVSDLVNRAANMLDGDQEQAKWFVRGLSIDLQTVGVRYKYNMDLEDQFEDTMKLALSYARRGRFAKSFARWRKRQA